MCVLPFRHKKSVFLDSFDDWYKLQNQNEAKANDCQSYSDSVVKAILKCVKAIQKLLWTRTNADKSYNLEWKFSLIHSLIHTFCVIRGIENAFILLLKYLQNCI